MITPAAVTAINERNVPVIFRSHSSGALIGNAGREPIVAPSIVCMSCSFGLHPGHHQIQRPAR